jgi:hypothetical protein
MNYKYFLFLDRKVTGAAYLQLLHEDVIPLIESSGDSDLTLFQQHSARLQAVNIVLDFPVHEKHRTSGTTLRGFCVNSRFSSAALV